MIRVRTFRGVALAAVATTLGAICFAEVLALLIYPISSGSTAYLFAPLIAALTAFPISFFIWAKMRENVQLNEALQRLLDRDRLTDAATRDFFFARMAAEPEAYGVSLMVDIDHFKRVNDTYGHLAGDRVIAEVARILNANVRKDDIVCRFGGEEFMIFLQDHGRDDGFAAAERMRALVERHRLLVGEVELAVTVSIGGSLKDRVADVMQSIHDADAALYRAKQLGRNRTVFAPPEERRAA